MTKDLLLKYLIARQKKIRLKISLERKEAEMLKYKSRRVRQQSPLHARIGWYTDRVQELELVIRLIKDETTPKDFIRHKIDDSYGKLCTEIGNMH